MRKSDQTSIKAVHMHLHVRCKRSSGYISDAISAFAKLMVAAEIGDDRNASGRCASVSCTARRYVEGRGLVGRRDSNGLRVTNGRTTCRYC
jgi:hypothetical protein